MNKNTLETALNNLPIGRLRYYEKVSSTNDIALAWGDEDSGDFSIAIANEQSAGRGRSGRVWQTPSDSALAFSLLLIPDIRETKHIPLFTGLGALALVDTLRQHYALDAKIKWPNDILINEKKIAGILVEANWQGDKIKNIVLGMGVNVYKNSVPSDVLFPATSLEDLKPDVFSKPIRSLLLSQILEALIKRRPSLGRGNLHNAWDENLAFKGKQVQIHARNTPSAQSIPAGRIIGINSDGSLRLDTHPAIHFGDVHLRPMQV